MRISTVTSMLSLLLSMSMLSARLFFIGPFLKGVKVDTRPQSTAPMTNHMCKSMLTVAFANPITTAGHLGMQ